MQNLKQLVGIRSDKNCNEILEFLENKLKDSVEEVKIYEENGVSALIAGINTRLKDIYPHRAFRTH